MFTRATKKQRKARIAIYGPSGSGKTFSALRIARGLVGSSGRIALIDTEGESASIYADRFEFDAASLTNATIDLLSGAVHKATEYDVLIIDSLSHAWKELLVEVERLAKAKYKGNTWSAWSEGTPKQSQLLKTLLGFPGHLICTMRAKTEWATEAADSNGSGKSKPVRLGLAPEQGKGIEYEFDMLISITEAHVALVEKDRTGKWQDAALDKPGEEFGRELAEWLGQGEPPPPPPVPDESLLAVLRTSVANARDTRAVRAAFDRFASENPNAPTMEAGKAICRQRHNMLEEAEQARQDAERVKREAEQAQPPADDYMPPAEDGPRFEPDADHQPGSPVNSKRRATAGAK